MKVRTMFGSTLDTKDIPFGLRRDRDSDRDGVPNSLDCKPYNPHKQGVLHDISQRYQKWKAEEPVREEAKIEHAVRTAKLEEAKARIERARAAQRLARLAHKPKTGMESGFRNMFTMSPMVPFGETRQPIKQVKKVKYHRKHRKAKRQVIYVRVAPRRRKVSRPRYMVVR